MGGGGWGGVGMVTEPTPALPCILKHIINARSNSYTLALEQLSQLFEWQTLEFENTRHSYCSSLQYHGTSIRMIPYI